MLSWQNKNRNRTYIILNTLKAFDWWNNWSKGNSKLSTLVSWAWLLDSLYFMKTFGDSKKLRMIICITDSLSKFSWRRCLLDSSACWIGFGLTTGLTMSLIALRCSGNGRPPYGGPKAFFESYFFMDDIVKNCIFFTAVCYFTVMYCYIYC